ncbi:hypothetical protein PspLS_10420 [Pyricularia sp. CBS 133598]|nr:hypothetical protein PspLS_10420 [Pyricularia sp. CBS 133598]
MYSASLIILSILVQEWTTFNPILYRVGGSNRRSSMLSIFDEAFIPHGDNSDQFGVMQYWPLLVLEMEAELEEVYSEATQTRSTEDDEFLGVDNEGTLWEDNVYDDPLDFLLEKVQSQCPDAWGLLSDPAGLTQRQLATFTSMPEGTTVKGPGYKAVCRRIRSHYAEKSDGHGIFHRLWFALPTRTTWFFSLGSCDQASSALQRKDLGLWLNIVEKLFAPGFQTLPMTTLSTMTPSGRMRLTEV